MRCLSALDPLPGPCSGLAAVPANSSSVAPSVIASPPSLELRDCSALGDDGIGGGLAVLGVGSGGRVVLDGINFTNCNASASGGGLAIEDSTVELG